MAQVTAVGIVLMAVGLGIALGANRSSTTFEAVVGFVVAALFVLAGVALVA